MHFIGIVWLLGVGAAHAQDLGPQGLAPYAEFPADVPHTQHQHRAAIDGPHCAQAFPCLFMLGVPVQLQLFKDFQQHAQHVLGDGQAVSPRGIGQHNARL